MIQNSLLLSRYKLKSFLECQRRFQLRYISRLRWPAAPAASGLAEAFGRGAQFHRLLEQHFLGLPVTLPPDADPKIRAWWDTFQQSPPRVPDGKRYPEVSLTVPVGDQFLFGRYDLLILNEQQAHIFDWKTERRPRSAQALKEDWQTRLYLTMVVEGCQALGRTYTPEQVAITYWFAHAPEKSVTLQYDSDQHRTNWAELKATVERIERRMVAPDAVWPLTDNWELCKQCGYRTFCDRAIEVESADQNTLEMLSEEQPDSVLEPEL